jgi:hypothetical protein
MATKDVSSSTVGCMAVSSTPPARRVKQPCKVPNARTVVTRFLPTLFRGSQQQVDCDHCPNRAQCVATA